MSPAASYSPPGFDLPVELDLSKNEGRPPDMSLLDHVADEAAVVSRYPDLSSLRRRIAVHVGVDPNQVLVTAGGDDALFRCFLARLGPGRKAVATYPSFEMIPVYAAQVGAELTEVGWWTGDFPGAEVATAAVGADVVFVVSPNNPTGSVISETALRTLAAKVRLVVLDAAYTEFADVDLTGVGVDLDNVVTVRTFSKAWGLAGLRVGYLLGNADLVSEIGAYANPYPVSGLSASLAANRLSATREVSEFVETVKHQRRTLTGVFEAHGVETLPSEANFVLARFTDAEWVTRAAASLGVGLRRFPERLGLEDHVRITLPGTESGFGLLVHVVLSAIAPDALLFDLDGVLADVSRSQVVAIIETAAAFGVEVSTEDVDEAKAVGNANDDWELTRRLCFNAGIEVSLSEVTARYETIYQGRDGRTGLKLAEMPLVDVDTLGRWAERFAIGVVTGRPRRDADEFLTRAGLADVVSVVVTRDDAPPKPDPGPVRLALDRLGVRRAWMLGDTPDDIVAARQAGVIPIGVTAPGSNRDVMRDALADAACILDRTTELEGLLP